MTLSQLLFITKILFTLLMIITCRLFIIDAIEYFKQKRYFKVCLGIILIIYFIYKEYQVLTL